MKPSVLVAEDEGALVTLLRYNLEREGYRVLEAHDGEEALLVASEEKPDLVLLDWMLPQLSGIEVCRRLRGRQETRNVPIIMLTARGEEADRIRGFETGADDYVTKPFSVRELLGRVRAQLRRRELDRSPLSQAARIESGPVSIDLVRHVATVRGQVVNLTRSEFQLLRLLVGRPGEVFARSQIMEELWQTEFDGDERACDVHISNLRQKVERDPQKPELVLTVRGVGYKFDGQSS